MSLETRVKWAFYSSMAMMAPAIRNVVRGHLEIFDFAKFYMAAFLAAWIGISILHRVIVWFAFETARRQIESQIGQPRRRRVDRHAAAPPAIADNLLAAPEVPAEETVPPQQ